jgi:hypothetical protein
MTTPAENLALYSEVRPLIRNGDLLFWHATNLFGRYIAHKTHGPFSHVGSASWAGDVLESHEMLQWYGGRTCNLSALVRQYPGKIHVYRMPRLHGFQFSQRQRRRAGEKYGWRDLLYAGHNTIKDDFGMEAPARLKLSAEDRENLPDLWKVLWSVPVDQPAFCSQGVISDMRAVGVDPYPDLAAWMVDPNMLGIKANYLFTLTM